MTLFQLNTSPQTVQFNMCCFIYSIVLSSIDIHFAAYITRYMQWNVSIKKLGQTEVFICGKTTDSMNIRANHCTYNKRELDKTKTKKKKKNKDACYVSHSTFARSRNQCCRENATGITHSERVCSLISPACKAHAVLCCHLWNVRLHHNFPHYLIKNTILDRITSLHIFFSTNFIWNIFRSKKNSAKYHRKCIVLHVKYQLFLSHFKEALIFTRDVRNIFKYQISWKAVQWTDKMKLTVGFCNLANAPSIKNSVQKSMLRGITCVWVFRTGNPTEGEMILLLGTVSRHQNWTTDIPWLILGRCKRFSSTLK